MKGQNFIPVFMAMQLLGSWACGGEAEMKSALEYWSQREAEYNAALSVATTDEQRASLPPPSATDFAPRLWKAVRNQTGTREVTAPGVRQTKGKETSATRKVPTYEFEEDWAAPAVVWFLNHPEALAKLYEKSPKKLATYAEALLDSVDNKHYSSPLIGGACAKLAENTGAQVYAVLEKIYERNTTPAVRGAAAMAMSIMLANPNLAEAGGGRARVRAKRIYLIRQALNLSPEDAKFGELTLTQVAEEQIYRIRNLGVGTIPPQLKLTDSSGQSNTFPVLGKVNLIFFWSPAEDVGLSIMKKQSALMKQYPSLELCPVVPHSESEQLQGMMTEQGILTCYMDDEKGTAGSAYRVNQLPMAVLVDEHARILYLGYPDMQLQAALNECFSASHRKLNATPPDGTRSATPPPPALQQPSPAAPAPGPVGNDTPPALREMPQL